MIALLGAVLGTALLGSLHCAGMCGGFACLVAGDGATRRLGPQAAYHGGRLLTYLALGTAAGALGAGLDQTGAQAGLGRAAAVAAGLITIAWGVLGWWRLLDTRRVAPPAAARWRAPLVRVLRRAAGWPPAWRALAVGAVTTLLPCGFLYAYVAVAGGTGSVPGSVLVMTVFWVGTLPVLAGLGLAARGVLDPLRRRLPLVTASALVILGLLTVAGRTAPGFHGHDPAAARPAHGSHHGAR